MRIKTAYTLIASICLVLLFSQCYDEGVVSSIIAEKENFQFNANGGVETVKLYKHGKKKIESNIANWSYGGCFDKQQKKVEMKTEELPDGSIKIYNNWVCFTSPRDRKSITIKVEKNSEATERFISFYGPSLALAFALNIHQDKQ